MTCERGLRDYMICTECHSVFHSDAIEVGENFNCSPDTSVVCSVECEKKLMDKLRRGDWMKFEGYSESVSEISE